MLGDGLVLVYQGWVPDSLFFLELTIGLSHTPYPLVILTYFTRIRDLLQVHGRRLWNLCPYYYPALGTVRKIELLRRAQSIFADTTSCHKQQCPSANIDMVCEEISSRKVGITSSLDITTPWLEQIVVERNTLLKKTKHGVTWIKDAGEWKWRLRCGSYKSSDAVTNDTVHSAGPWKLGQIWCRCNWVLRSTMIYSKQPPSRKLHYDFTAKVEIGYWDIVLFTCRDSLLLQSGYCVCIFSSLPHSPYSYCLSTTINHSTMPVTLYEASVVPFIHTLKNLLTVIEKARAHVGNDEKVITEARLIGDMQDFCFQIRKWLAPSDDKSD